VSQNIQESSIYIANKNLPKQIERALERRQRISSGLSPIRTELKKRRLADYINYAA
jgi:hypothetical protein